MADLEKKEASALYQCEIKERVDKVMSFFPKSYVSDLKADIKYVLPFIQYDKEEIDRVQKEFIKIVDDVLHTNYAGKTIHRLGVIGRVIDDSGNKVLYKAWHRFMCIDELYREWEQPYFAINYQNYKSEDCTCINDKYPELLSHFRDKKLNTILKDDL